MDFFNKYLLVSSTGDLPVTQRPLKCRYCARATTEVTFRQRTHLLPELLGKNSCIIHDECDACNGYFARFEKDLATFLLPYRSMLGLRGKKKAPKFRSRPMAGAMNTEMEVGHSEGSGVQMTIRTPSDLVIDHRESTGTITFRMPPFIPLNVYKALLKVGLGLAPAAEIEKHRDSFDWLVGKRGELTFEPRVFFHRLSRHYFSEPSATLYKARKLVIDQTELPEYSLVVCAANVVLQLFLPFTDELMVLHDGRRTLSLNIFPGFAWDGLQQGSRGRISIFDLSIPSPVELDIEIPFEFDSIETTVES